VEIFFQQILNGIVIGSVYSLVALGLTLMFGILEIPNFGHGSICMVGAFATFYLTTLAGFNFYLAVLTAMVITGVLGYGIEKIFFKPIRGKGLDAGLIAALALALFVENLGLKVFSEQTRTIPSDTVILNFAGITISSQRLMAVAVSVIAIIILQLFIKRTRLGKAMRATAENPKAASLMGINIDTISTATFVIGSALAGLAGSMIGSMFSVYPTMGGVLIMTAFVIVVLGGLGNIAGAIMGGYILGLAVSLGGGYAGTRMHDAFPFIILVLVMIIKPTGLFGERKREA